MNTSTKIESGARYHVTAIEEDGDRIWFVVDRTGGIAPRLIGLNANGRREAVWLARILNG